MTLYVSTQNPDKLRELRQLLGPDSPIEHPGPEDPEVEESGATLRENARLKALAGFQRKGLPSLADDTGLEVDGLDGEPGVYSSRYAGQDASYEDNVRKLLHELHGKSGEQRRARFRTVMVYLDGKREHAFEGVLEGRIIDAARGDKGFGYDPIFVPEGQQRSLAELDAEEKNAISHRGRALRAFVHWWQEQTEQD